MFNLASRFGVHLTIKSKFINKQMKIYSVILVFILCLPFCKVENKKSVGLLIPDLKKERWRKDDAFIKQRAKELNLDLIAFDANGNEEIQLKQAQELMDKGVSVIILASVNANLNAAVVRDAHKRNIKVIAYDRFIKNCDLDYYVSHNNINVGELIAENIVSVKPVGNYILFYGDRADQNAIFVKQGMLNILQPLIDAGKIKIVYQTFIEGWQGSEAYLELNRFFRYSKDSVDAVLSSGDGIAQGVIQVLEENGLAQKVLVTGQNADISAVKSILKGDQILTIYKPLKDLAFAATDLALELIQGKSPSNIGQMLNNGKIDVPSTLIPVKMVNKSNIDDILINSGFYTKDEVYGN